jgi:transcriptional regulator GlxA family with amidase domain
MAFDPIHVVLWLPTRFYSGVASTFVEILELVNNISRAQVLSFEFVSKRSPAVSTTGISFHARANPSRKMDALVLMATPGLDVPELIRALDRESKDSKPVIELAQRQGAIIAAHCGGCYLLAHSGALDGKRSTISWWLKTEVTRRFPRVRWDASRLLIRQGRIYTCGGGFAGLELAKALLVDLGFAKEERIVRKLLLLPPAREFQSPYEFPLETLAGAVDPFAQRLNELSKKHLRVLDLTFLARALGMSSRTMSRRFGSELQIGPGKWIQQKRLAAAKALLEGTKLSIAEVCHRIGYEDVASFSRLFSKTTGMAPGEFRKQIRG